MMKTRSKTTPTHNFELPLVAQAWEGRPRVARRECWVLDVSLKVDARLPGRDVDADNVGAGF
eukprot:2239634-Pyramimonas_sp.AAC.1